jgi:preprotein translocase subunit SecA
MGMDCCKCGGCEDCIQAQYFYDEATRAPEPTDEEERVAREQLKERYDKEYEIAKNIRVEDHEKRSRSIYELDRKIATYRAQELPGRNSKCPCGSDKKYKFCCLNKDKGYL